MSSIDDVIPPPFHYQKNGGQCCCGSCVTEERKKKEFRPDGMNDECIGEAPQPSQKKTSKAKDSPGRGRLSARPARPFFFLL
jgi:hypothetical protein